MSRYASNTNVPIGRSQEELKDILRRYGADGFGTMERGGIAMVLFEFNGLGIRIDVTLPDRADKEFNETDTGRARSEDAAHKAYEQAVRQRWRALLLAVKAKLEAVACGISTIETEFMPFVVMPDGQTLGTHLLPKLRQIAVEGNPLKALPAPPTAS
jgi:hypothetical protein